MIRKIVYFSLIVVAFTACSTTQKTTKTNSEKVVKKAEAIVKTIPSPVGTEFKNFTNFDDFASINIPVSGEKFNGKIESPGQIMPTVRYGSNPVKIWSSLNGFEGSLDEQFNKMKRLARLVIKEESKVIFEQKTIGDHKVGLIDITRDLGTSGYSIINYGYLVEHDKKASLFLLKDYQVLPEQDKNEVKKNIDEVFTYMIKTMKFK